MRVQKDDVTASERVGVSIAVNKNTLILSPCAASCVPHNVPENFLRVNSFDSDNLLHSFVKCPQEKKYRPTFPAFFRIHVWKQLK